MGAELKLDSALGRGSRFYFSLQLALPADAAEQGFLDGFSASTATASEALDDTMAVLVPLPQPLLSQVAACKPAQPGRLHGLRLLVVEDNLNNQQVARELLEDEGAVVSVASDGQQALTQLAQGKRDGLIDAVLMDIQMPVMDGYTATRLIRRQLKLQMPIIAMTANALQVDRQACLDVGMDEHVGKPFDIEHLVGVLLRHCGARTVPGSMVMNGHGAAGRQLPLDLPAALLLQADVAGIALAEALGRMSGKSALFVRMAAALSEEAADLPTPLTAAALHRFRGLAATLGARTLAALAAQGERLLKAGQPMAEGWQASFAEAIQRDLPALTDLARQLQADEAPPPVAASSDTPTLGALIELLQGADMAALAAYEQLRPVLLATDPSQVRLLDLALNRLAFGEAAALCQALGEPPRHGLHEPQVSSA
jgi:CheY-like chemotaxis protein